MLVKKRIIVLAADIAVIAFALLAPSLASLLMNSLSECFFLERGILCPACGGTRCVYSFFSGRFAEAIAYNAAFFCAIIYGLVLLLWLNIDALRPNRVSPTAIRLMTCPATVFTALGLYLVYGLLRNIL